MTADDEALERERRRESILRRLARVEAAISLWHEWEANPVLPPAQHRVVAKPELSLAECLDVRRMLREELARLDGA